MKQDIKIIITKMNTSDLLELTRLIQIELSKKKTMTEFKVLK